MKNDIQLEHDIEEELQWDPTVDASRFTVQAKDDVITFSGGADTFADKYAAEEAVRRVAGMTALVTHVDARVPPDMERPNGETAQAIGSALHWNAPAPPGAVQVTVEGGAVTLRGEADRGFQRRAALDAMRRVHSVKSVASALILRATSGPADLSDHVTKILQRLAAIDTSRLDVSVTDGMMTLYDPLRNLSERRAAREAAWDAPGVRTIIDQMWVGS